MSHSQQVVVHTPRNNEKLPAEILEEIFSLCPRSTFDRSGTPWILTKVCRTEPHSLRIKLNVVYSETGNWGTIFNILRACCHRWVSLEYRPCEGVDPKPPLTPFSREFDALERLTLSIPPSAHADLGHQTQLLFRRIITSAKNLKQVYLEGHWNLSSSIRDELDWSKLTHLRLPGFHSWSQVAIGTLSSLRSLIIHYADIPCISDKTLQSLRHLKLLGISNIGFNIRRV
ncbi:hypothetical protein PM082_012619 [Marasmius tenuissimus]|nr:hypothetical protein PM082_012619 [Marasmius tenuissimus]